MDGFPFDPEPLRAALVRALELKGWDEEATAVRVGKLEIDPEGHDNWNGGIDFYGLRVEIPLESFVKLEDRLEELEERILRIAKTFWRAVPSEDITKVTVSPVAPTAAGLTFLQPPASLPSYWAAGKFRLFLSHCATHKSRVAKLQETLEPMGISSFVAHIDIEPTKEWEAEILRGLQTMEALVAVLTTDFPSSRWCDQEVGVALGTGRLVIPIRVDIDPYGFLGRYQALSARTGALDGIATAIVRILIKHDSTAVSMQNALVRALADSRSFAESKTIVALLETTRRLSEENVRILAQALKENGQVDGAWGVPERVRGLINLSKVRGRRRTVE